MSDFLVLQNPPVEVIKAVIAHVRSLKAVDDLEALGQEIFKYDPTLVLEFWVYFLLFVDYTNILLHIVETKQKLQKRPVCFGKVFSIISMERMMDS